LTYIVLCVDINNIKNKMCSTIASCANVYQSKMYTYIYMHLELFPFLLSASVRHVNNQEL